MPQPSRSALALSLVFVLGAAGAGCDDGTHRVEVRSDDCYTCHLPDYEGAARPMHPGRFPTTCADCHSTLAWHPAIGGHPEPQFPIETGAHMPVICDDCHDSTRGSDAGGANTICVDCHSGEHLRPVMDPLHAGLPGYPTGDAPSTFCLTCHPDGTRNATVHPDADFPISMGPHMVVACFECHNPTLGSPGAGGNTDCVGCHTGTHERAAMDLRHRGVVVAIYPTGPAPPNFCLVCHPTGLAPIQLHPEARFSIAAGQHSGLMCNDCHDTSRGANTGGANTTCIGCHLGNHERAVQDPNHLGRPGYPTGTAPVNFCLTCHPDGTASAARHPEALFPVETGPHSAFTCTDCHDATRGVNTGGANTNCVDCHTGEHDRATVDAAHAGRSGYPTGPAAPNFCLTCHPDGSAAAAAHPETRFSITGTHRMECSDCHNTALGPNAGGQNTDCVGCHEGVHTRAQLDPKHSGVSGYPGDTSRPNFCLRCHPDGRNN